jgi:hypothetical protein
MNTCRHRLLLLLFTLAIGALAGCACPKVQKPSSDSSPPTINWKVRNESTNAVQTFTGNASFQAQKNEHYVVTMTAADSGGVHEATLTDETSWSCKQGSAVSSSGPGLTVPLTEKHDEWPSGQVCSEIDLILDKKLEFTCQSGYQFNGALVRLTATGKNFYNGQTTAQLTINIP